MYTPALEVPRDIFSVAGFLDVLPCHSSFLPPIATIAVSIITAVIILNIQTTVIVYVMLASITVSRSLPGSTSES